MKIVVSLRDKVAGMYMQPMFVPTVGASYRSLQDEIHRGGEGNTLAAHAEDFQLFQLGTFDEDTGLFQLEATPKLLCDVATLRVKE